MKFALSYAIKEDSRKKCYYFICLFACFLVSLVSLVSKSIVTQGSLISLMLSEKERGEMNIVFEPVTSRRKEDNSPPKNFYYDYSFINYTKYGIKMKNYKGKKNPLLTSTIRTKFNGRLITKNQGLEFYLINSTKEKEIELGRSYPYSKLNEDECIIHNSFQNFISKDNYLEFMINLDKFLSDHLLLNYYETNSSYSKSCEQINIIPKNIKIKCKIKEIINDTYGKLEGDSKYLIFMENENFFSYLSNYLNDNKTLSLFPDYKNILKKQIKIILEIN